MLFSFKSRTVDGFAAAILDLQRLKIPTFAPACVCAYVSVHAHLKHICVSEGERERETEQEGWRLTRNGEKGPVVIATLFFRESHPFISTLQKTRQHLTQFFTLRILLYPTPTSAPPSPPPVPAPCSPSLECHSEERHSSFRLPLQSAGFILVLRLAHHRTVTICDNWLSLCVCHCKSHRSRLRD